MENISNFKNRLSEALNLTNEEFYIIMKKRKVFGDRFVDNAKYLIESFEKKRDEERIAKQIRDKEESFNLLFDKGCDSIIQDTRDDTLWKIEAIKTRGIILVSVNDDYKIKDVHRKTIFNNFIILKLMYKGQEITNLEEYLVKKVINLDTKMKFLLGKGTGSTIEDKRTGERYIVIRNRLRDLVLSSREDRSTKAEYKNQIKKHYKIIKLQYHGEDVSKQQLAEFEIQSTKLKRRITCVKPTNGSYY